MLKLNSRPGMSHLVVVGAIGFHPATDIDIRISLEKLFDNCFIASEDGDLKSSPTAFP